ncbi:hypothetical protein [Clostridium tagluense]|nr:hypothetical protein [Clostridium tagluense]
MNELEESAQVIENQSLEHFLKIENAYLICSYWFGTYFHAT